MVSLGGELRLAYLYTAHADLRQILEYCLVSSRCCFDFYLNQHACDCFIGEDWHSSGLVRLFESGPRTPRRPVLFFPIWDPAARWIACGFLGGAFAEGKRNLAKVNRFQPDSPVLPMPLTSPPSKPPQNKP